MKRSPGPFFIAALVVAASVSCRGRDEAARFDAASDGLFAEGYTRALVAYFSSLGTNPDLGFRWAGTTAERAVGERVAAEMRAMGLRNVRLEPVPVDVIEFRGASVAVGDRAMIASTIAGTPPTPAAGLTAPVVYVKAGTAADFDAAGDVAGRIVLVDLRLSSWWFFWPAFEAARLGAAGIICTYTPEDTKYFSFDDATLGSFDGQYDLGAPPWVYLARRDGDWLKSRLAAGPVTATLTLDEKLTLERDGGLAYNVLGEVPGESGDGQMVLMAAHQDAHFRAGVDDTGALANMLAVAKAMRGSGYRPKHTVVFFATAAEEFGLANSYYDWLTGAWWAVARAHPDWPGKIRGMINFESMALKGTALSVRTMPELEPWLRRLAGKNPALLPDGFEVILPVSCWNDQWPFTAAGVPSLKFDTTDEAYDKLYHSNRETAELVDAGHLARLAKFAFRMILDLDRGPLPYGLKARADEIAAAVKPGELAAAGADRSVVSRLAEAVSGFSQAAEAFDRGAAAVPGDRIEDSDRLLLDVEKDLNSGLTALSPAEDDATVYPHQPLLREVQGLGRALAALSGPKPDRGAALEALTGTGMTRWGRAFGEAVYRKQLARISPGFPRLGFGELGHLPEPLDIMPQIKALESGRVADAVSGLEEARRERLGLLDASLAETARILERASARLAPFYRP